MICAALNRHKDVADFLSLLKVFYKLLPSKAAACKSFEATIVDFGEFQKKKLCHSYLVWDLLYRLEYNSRPIVPVLPKRVNYRQNLR